MGSGPSRAEQGEQSFLQLTFAPGDTAPVRALQEKLAEVAGVTPGTWLEPHITLAAGELVAAAALGTFGPEGGVLFLSPAYTPDLMGLYQRLYGVLEQHAQSLNPLYAPSLWVPHCTLLMNLAQPQVTECIRDLLEAWPLPLTVRAGPVQLCRYPSLEVVQEWELSS